MIKSICFQLLILVCITGCVAASKKNQSQTASAPSTVTRDTLTLFDTARNRVIPIALYATDSHHALPVVIFSHGYGKNDPNGYLVYSYLTNELALNGFFVVSIQHELATDSLLPTSGIPQIVRRPFWERGADNILFVLNTLKRTHPELDFRHVSLVGHSNGGDMSALFPQKYPGLISKVITLDNRRMPLPRTTFPTVYSLRSNDTPADPGVLPSLTEQDSLGISVIHLAHTPHSSMDDSGNKRQKREITDYVLRFLKAPQFSESHP